MKFPKMRPSGSQRLSVPDLAGGLNLRDGISEVLDNQLTEAKNVWYQDGLLKTRPGVSALGEIFVGRITKQKNVGSKIWPNVKYKADGKEYVLTVIKKDEDVDYIGQYKTALKFYWQSNKGTIDITWLTFDEEVSYFVTQNNSTVYLYASNCEVYKLQYSLHNDVNEFVLVPKEDYYIPTVLTNCLSDDSATRNKPRGDIFEAFNLLTPHYKAIYSTVNKDLFSNDKNTQNMFYILPFDAGVLTLKEAMITVKITYKDGKTATHQISTNASNAMEEEPNPTDNLAMKFSRTFSCSYISFYTVEVDSEGDKIAKIKTLSEDDYLENNMEIIAPNYSFSNVITTTFDNQKVFNMTQCEWFGGGTEGIAGGTRLFLGGNTEEANKNLVVWSDLNNPLYFPENNYFRVGENSSAVTGFGKQADMLVIFKENGSGIYYTKYQQNSDITAEDLINQNVVDYVASSVYFPLVQINPNVGCSHPETIQLCRNRLVWLGDNGDVFTLVSESQYNERSVFCVSEMVRRDLKKNVSVIPTACDWNGYYCLMCDNKLYLMDYNCYGYTHVASYSKTEDANVRIPWYIWELPFEASMCESDGDILFTRYNDGESYAECAVLNYALSPDNRTVDNVYVFDSENGEFALEKRPIQTVLRTKLFTFGEASVRKSVDKINLQLGNNGGEPIAVKVITDQSEEEHDIYLTGTETETYTPGYIDSKAIFPTARNFLRIGLELSSEGVIAVDGMEFKFRTSGGAR